MSRIIIIGAGPSSFVLSKELARKGKSVYIFDHKVPWEKPCGGILSYQVTSEFIDINEYPYPYKCYEGMHAFLEGNESTFLRYEYPFYVVSRKDLSGYMRERMLDYGISFLSEKVTKIYYNNKEWHVVAGGREYTSDIIIGADGANSLTRRTIVGPLPKKHRYYVCGYFLNDSRIDRCIVKFFDFPGYIWLLACPSHATAGIMVLDGFMDPASLFLHLYRFINDLYPSANIIKKYSAYIPAASDPSFYDQPCSGENWILVGDAAGHVEPFLGEGIYYALKSGQLAAQAITSNKITSYDKTWREEYGNTFIELSLNKQNLIRLIDQFGPKIYGAYLFKSFLPKLIGKSIPG